MSFLDFTLPATIPGTPCASVPRFRTSILVSAGGGEQRNQHWEHPLRSFTLPEAVRKWPAIDALGKMWTATKGPFHSFSFRDPHDFASCDLERPNMVPAVDGEDQAIGIGDGFTDRFQLVKQYGYGGETYLRTIHLPVLESVVVAIDGVVVDPGTYSVSRPGGELLFDVPPAAPSSGHPQVITAGFLFDCEVRFEGDDQLEQILRARHLSGAADLTLIEVRPC